MKTYNPSYWLDDERDMAGAIERAMDEVQMDMDQAEDDGDERLADRLCDIYLALEKRLDAISSPA